MNNMIFHRKLPIPMDIKEQFPVTDKILKTREQRIGELNDILIAYAFGISPHLAYVLSINLG